MNCQDCGEKIPQKRLEAVPNARYCVACQKLAEEEVAVPDSALAMPEVDDWERARQARSYRHQRRIGGQIPQEAA